MAWVRARRSERSRRMRGGHLLGYPEEAAPQRLAVKVALAAGVACEQRPQHAPAADNASLKVA
eukprot:scaffold8721_cov80-Phaeocystis_antarctica.AAC.21